MVNKLISMCLVSMMVLGMCAPALAAAIPAEEQGEIIQIMFFDESGKQHIYRGQQAIEVYNGMDNSVKTDISELPENRIPDRGAFGHRYRFVKSSSGTRNGQVVRITNYMVNETSIMQGASISASVHVDWSINTKFTGRFKNVFERSVGSSWTKARSFSDTFDFNIPPNKKVWLEFKPRLNYVEGEYQRYFIPRGPWKNHTVVIEEREKVISTSPKTVNITISGKTVIAPDGVYIWRQADKIGFVDLT